MVFELSNLKEKIMKNLLPEDDLLRFYCIMVIFAMIGGFGAGIYTLAHDYVNKDMNKAAIEAGLEQDHYGHWIKPKNK